MNSVSQVQQIIQVRFRLKWTRFYFLINLDFIFLYMLWAFAFDHQIGVCFLIILKVKFHAAMSTVMWLQMMQNIANKKSKLKKCSNGRENSFIWRTPEGPWVKQSLKSEEKRVDFEIETAGLYWFETTHKSGMIGYEKIYIVKF